MKLNINISDNDKRALTVLTAFIVIILPFRLLLQPAAAKYNELKKEYEACAVKKAAVENNVIKYNAGIGVVKTAEEEYAETVGEIYPLTSANNIDKKITEIAYNCGLNVTDSKTVSHSEPVVVEPYKYSKLYEAGLEEENANTTAAVYSCDYSINVNGSIGSIYSFMDKLAEESTGCHIKSYSMYDYDGEYALKAEIVIYMAE